VIARSAGPPLGAAQENRLADALSTSATCWNVLAQQTLIAPFEYRATDGGYDVWTDGWDGYAGARSRLLQFIEAAQVRNVIALGGDMHAFYVTDLKTDFADANAPPIATEFVGTSITSNDVDYAAVSRDLPHNPHIRYFDSRWRGYLYCEITPELWRTDLRIVDDASNAASCGRTLASLYVEDGRPGAQPG
jgi:alkaline phosphatase D